MQLSFIESKEPKTPKVKGLRYIEDYISDLEQIELLKSINQQTWLADLNRRVQHYGYKYDYKTRKIDHSMRLGTLPKWTEFITERIFKQKLIKQHPDQIIINEYKAGQGISPHIDCEPCFDGTIISLSLGSSVVMDFKNVDDTDFPAETEFGILLKPKSLLILNDHARYNWTHGIKANKAFNFNNSKYSRRTRISLTFRKVIIE